MRQIFLIVLFELPLAMLYFLNFAQMQQIISSISLALVALILGYLFPKSQGSLNETTSILLLFVVFILISLLMSNPTIGWLVLFTLGVMHFILIRKVRHEKE